MKLISPHINPIYLNTLNSNELESESYRSNNVLNCQHYHSTDYLQFIIYFEKDDATNIVVKCNGVAIATATTLSSAAFQQFSNSYWRGERRFNKGWLVFRAKISDFFPTGTSFYITVDLYNSTSHCYLQSNSISISDSGKLIKYSNTYDTADCNYSYLTGLFEYRVDALFYDTDIVTEATIFKGANGVSDVVTSSMDEKYILNIGGEKMISLADERIIRNILCHNVKIIDGIELELTEDVNIVTTKLFRRAGRSLDITLRKKVYENKNLSITTGTGATITTNRVVRYDETSTTLAIDPSSLTTITVTDDLNKAIINKTLINQREIINIDFGINNLIDHLRTVGLIIQDSNSNTKTITYIQNFSPLLLGDQIMDKNLILR